MLKKKFNTEKPIIGMIHTEALPGTPNYKGDDEYHTDYWLSIRKALGPGRRFAKWAWPL